jgi:hypothetical protein
MIIVNLHARLIDNSRISGRIEKITMFIEKITTGMFIDNIYKKKFS